METIALIAAVLGTGLLVGCEGEPSTTATKTPATTRPSDEPTGEEKDRLKSLLEEEARPKQPAMPPGHPPIGSQQDSAAPPREPVSLAYEVPADWEREQPASRMRRDQLRIPPAEGDEEAGELAVFHFGRQAGSIDQNIARWRGQFTTAEGAPLPEDAVRTEQIESDGLPIIVVEMAGQYSAGMMGGGPTKLRRMLGAIVATPDGPWFFKAVGPDATMAANRAAFMDLLASVKRPDDDGE